MQSTVGIRAQFQVGANLRAMVHLHPGGKSVRFHINIDRRHFRNRGPFFTGEEDAAKPQEFPGWLAELEASLDVRDKATFGGLLADDAKGFMVKSLRKKGLGGDYRDWDAITAWAEKIAADL